ncbi:hypothetical protein ACFWNN_05655 [Lentzea sp. NPDC058450]|uniref:hypothetical protein n=1 Tax=Lentzea sp. NPDC058450 TaxID=3346505 RepID=UPI003653F07D
MSKAVGKDKASRGTTPVKKKTGEKPKAKKKKASTPKKDPLVANLEKMRLTNRDTVYSAALRDAFGVDEFDSGEPPAVRKGYEFDRTELTRLADRVQFEADKLVTKNDEAQYNVFAGKLLDLTLRTSDVRSIAERTAGVQEAIAAMKLKVKADYPEIEASLDKLEAAKASADLDQAKGWLSDLETRLTTMREILDLVNARTTTPVTEFPLGLYKMTSRDLSLTKRGIALIPGKFAGVDALKIAFAVAEPPSALPDLHRLADDLGLDPKDVERKFSRPGQTGQAVHAMRVIKESGKDANFFLNGPGRQNWAALADIGARGLKAWPGGSREPVPIGPADGPEITFDELLRQAVRPRPGRKDLEDDQQGENPLRPRYLGGKHYINDVLKRGVVLPSVDGQGRPVQYTEYDIRPYTRPADRGGERLVVGGGRKFYTSDHYTTFVEIIG